MKEYHLWDAAGSVTLRFSARRHCCQALKYHSADCRSLSDNAVVTNCFGHIIESQPPENYNP
ncbi:hypothetical protein O5274_28170, partial [Escherichia coli]|nr:hypothetical protein [Escherichia coli]